MGSPLLQRRLIFVTGKGGVGKSTIALALGLAAARQGRRTIVAELAGNDELQRTFGQSGGAAFEEVQLAENLFTISIDPQSAMEEYLTVRLPPPAAVALRQSRLFGVFAMATPGMREMLSIGKVWELSQLDRRSPDAEHGYDLVIVDAPASGHGLALLRTPKTFSEIARVGPIAKQGATIAQTIADRSFTGVVAVAAAEEMPVNETLQLHDELLTDAMDLDAVVLNGLYPERFSEADVRALAELQDPAGGDLAGGDRATFSAAADAAIAAAISEHRRSAVQQPQRERLQTRFGERLLTLPYLAVPTVGASEIGELAELLGEELR